MYMTVSFLAHKQCERGAKSNIYRLVWKTGTLLLSQSPSLPLKLNLPTYERIEKTNLSNNCTMSHICWSMQCQNYFPLDKKQMKGEIGTM